MRHIIYIFLLLVPIKAFSQEEVNVVRKKTEHRFPCEENCVIKFLSLKANIKLNGWDRNEVKVTAYAVAKNKNVKQAKKELQYIKYYIDREGEVIIFKNVFSIPDKVKEVSSILQVEYEVFVPKNSKIYLTNKYGENYLSDLNGNVIIALSYGKLELNNLKANVSIRSDFVKIQGENLYGKFFLTSGNTDVNLSNLNNSSKIRIRTGKFFATTGKTMKGLRINARYCEVKLINSNINNYSYNLNAKYSSIELPIDKFEPQYISMNTKEEFKYIKSETTPLIFISTSFNNIKILEQ